MSLKTSDVFTVPLCFWHYAGVEAAGDERAWWAKHGIDPVPLAWGLWRRSHGLPDEADRPPEMRGSLLPVALIAFRLWLLILAAWAATTHN